MTAFTPARVVVRAPNWLGDVVLSLPALRDLRAFYPGARISVLARPSVAALYDAVPEADAVVEATGLVREIAVMRGGFDLAVLLTNSFGTALAPALAGVSARWGYATDGRGFLLTRKAPVPPSVRGRSQVNYYRLMLAAMGVATRETLDTSIQCPKAWQTDGRALLGPGDFFGIAPGAAKGSAKQWPPERFAAAADRIARELGAQPVLLGSAVDRPAAMAVSRRMKTPARNLCGQTDLRTFVGVVSELRALVANDSGAMHVGAALGIPTVGVFGPTNPEETHPVGARASLVRGYAECSPCQHATCPIDHRCMTSVSPDAVTERILQEARS